MKYFKSLEKVEIWRSCIISIEDDIDPIEAFQNGDYEIEDSCLLYDTELPLSPEENNGQPTSILKDEHGKIIWDNTKDDLSMQ